MIPKQPADLRPFQSRSELERERALEAHYHNIAIRGVLAAVQPRPPATDEKSLPRTG